MTKRRCLKLLKTAPFLLGTLSGQFAIAAVPHDVANDPRIPGAIAAPVAAEPAPTPSAPVIRTDAASVPADEVVTPDSATYVDAGQVECVAKVIVHEAGSEPHRGQVAVAQVIRARVKSGRFAADPCSVVKQRGQFFDVDAYQPSRTSAVWTNAVAIASETLAGVGDEVAPGALFFHAASSRGAFVGNRVRVAQIGGHVFYR